jgi:hypothetical protein
MSLFSEPMSPTAKFDQIRKNPVPMPVANASRYDKASEMREINV